MTFRSFSLKKYQHLQASRIGDLLEQFGDATDLGRRSRATPRRISRPWQCRDDLVVVGGILFLKQ